MTSTPFLVSKFSSNTLRSLIKLCFDSDFFDIEGKIQVSYLYRYLQDLGAESILLERRYQDRDFLNDFQLYYLKRFHNQGHECARLHFFSSEITHQVFEGILTAESDAKSKEQELQDNYLGFVVIKPLPKTFIGRTCLKEYPDGEKKRVILSRTLQVNLFGVSLEVDTIPYQEQDSITSACSTTAVWSCLHSLSWKSPYEVPGCAELTRNASGEHSNINHYPKSELSNREIVTAFDSEGVKVHSLSSLTTSEFINSVKVHINSGLPLLLGGEVYAIDNGGRCLGHHAVCIVGYSDTENVFYIHDDRVGPFARCVLLEHGAAEITKLGLDKEDVVPEKVYGLKIEAKSDKDVDLLSQIIVPVDIILPCKPKVRLPHLKPDQTCIFLSEKFESILNHLASLSEGNEEIASYMDAVSYQLQLMDISELREYARQSIDKLSAEKRADKSVYTEFLSRPLARNQWVATFYQNKDPVMVVTFDATEINQSNRIIGILPLDKTRYEVIRLGFEDLVRDSEGLASASSTAFVSSFLFSMFAKERNRESFLEKHYGELRAPNYIEDREFNHSNKAYYFREEDNPVLTVYEYTEQDLFKKYEKEFQSEDAKIIWAVDAQGSIRFGPDNGHVSLTRIKPARVAGEIIFKAGQGFFVNTKSGRYSGDYSIDQKNEYLGNVVKRLKVMFPQASHEFIPDEYNPV